ncbi:complement C1q binding protein P32 [Arctopsyche grandis]|uniref:complement C1q binding protein P32 n=1 Tax=Arctopsyche grandis TaxID=121162 RepID=UPI00406D8847
MNCLIRAAAQLRGVAGLAVAGAEARGVALRRGLALASGTRSPLVAATSTLRSPLPLVATSAPPARFMHSKGERELVEFLTEEITAERKAQKVKNIPTELDGFKVQLNGAEVTLTKKVDSETISINFNVNHTVDSESSDDEVVDADKEEFAEMRSRPQFEIDIIRGDATLSFTCSFIQDTQPVQEGDGYNDVFGIDEITMYQGEWNDKIYAVAGDVLDGYLYDLLMNYLEEKGISNEFAEKLSDFSTNYEHSAYICLLESLSKFTVKP